MFGEAEDARGDARDGDGPRTIGQAALEQRPVAAGQGGLDRAGGADGVEDVGDALVLQVVWRRHLCANSPWARSEASKKVSSKEEHGEQQREQQREQQQQPSEDGASKRQAQP